MKLEFSGSPAIAAPRERVWERLMDPHFVAQSAPGVESVEAVDPTHFKVISGFGVGSIRVRFTMDVELFDIDAGKSAKMRVRGKAPGSAIDVVSKLQVDDAGSGGTQLNWSATSEVSGTVASVGARLMEGTARKLTEQFWTDFAQRVSQEG
ncbi:MAG TPA: carbon monoxide dehydrogenase subunit G [Gemmatimonadales bacterium]|jgi:carbon monoxide dehydrogenase subunit G|nr:carbon monoxide dehydrogenase subunit G [Gemmatimonadales bacterium]